MFAEYPLDLQATAGLLFMPLRVGFANWLPATWLANCYFVYFTVHKYILHDDNGLQGFFQGFLKNQEYCLIDCKGLF